MMEIIIKIFQAFILLMAAFLVVIGSTAMVVAMMALYQMAQLL